MGECLAHACIPVVLLVCFLPELNVYEPASFPCRFQGSAILPVAMRSGCIVVSFDVLRPILPHSDDTSSNADRAQPAGCSPSAVAAAVQHWLQWQQRSTATRALFVQVREARART